MYILNISDVCLPIKRMEIALFMILVLSGANENRPFLQKYCPVLTALKRLNGSGITCLLTSLKALIVR